VREFVRDFGYVLKKTTVVLELDLLKIVFNLRKR